MAKKDKEVKEESTALVAPSEDGGAIQVFEDYGDDSGRGFENQDSSDVVMAFVKLLQGQSPEVTKFEDKGARAGWFINTLTEQLYTREKGFLFVPAVTKHVYAEWTPREKGGGFKGHHDVDSRIVLEAIKRGPDRDDNGEEKYGKYRTESGNQLTETFYMYGVTCTEDLIPDSFAVLPFWSSKIKEYRKLMTRIKQFMLRDPNNPGKVQRPPLFAHCLRVTSYQDENKKGDKFYVTKLSPADPRGMEHSLVARSNERFIQAKIVNEMVLAGREQINPDAMADDVIDAEHTDVPASSGGSFA